MMYAYKFFLAGLAGMLSGLVIPAVAQMPDANTILQKVDENMASENRVFESTMIVHGRRQSREIQSKTYSVGDSKAFTEYLSPAREAGTKMLKLDDQLWIYSPGTDRTIQLSGHMLRQSVMGSDLSYEDMMDNRTLTDIYQAEVLETTQLHERPVYVLELTAIVDDVNYASRKMWIDSERFVPLKEELFAKSGQLLKRTELSDVERIQGRWFPKTIRYKDMLKQGKGTVFQISKVQFNQDIPAYLLTKAALKQ